jgi:hypothetical protein
MKNTDPSKQRNAVAGFALRVVFWIAAAVALFFYFKSTR